MRQVLDQSQDISGQERHRIQQLYDVPEFVKSAAAVATCGDPETLQGRDYADQYGRIYPMHTAPATWLSTAFFFDKQSQLQPAVAQRIHDRLRERASFFGILPSFEAIQKRAAANADTDLGHLADSDFAYVTGTGAAKQRFCPLRNAAEVKVAAAWLEQYRDRFAFRTRQNMAGRITEKAARYGAALDNADYVEKQAGFGVCPASQAADLLASRVPYITGPEHATFKGEVEKTAASIRQRPSQTRNPEALCKLAALVDQIDRQFRLHSLYGNGLERPEDVLFAVTREKAAAFLNAHVNLTNGAVFEKESLGRLRVHDVREHMGDFADAITADGIHVDAEKVAEVAFTLPRSDADTFQRMCHGLGVLPVTTKAASVRSGMTAEETELWAAEYQPVLQPA